MRHRQRQYVVSAFGRTARVRLPPSRLQGASASLAGAFGGGGKPDTTYYRKANGLFVHSP
jgi:hypothetical protein